MDAKLVLVRKGLKPTVVKLKKLPMTVGRGREADLTIAHPAVSRLHCELYEVDGTLCIRDLGSMNGTYIGGSQITEASLESGDELIVGAARFQVVIDKEVDAGKEIEAPAVAADGEMEDRDGSFIGPTDFDDLQESEDDLQEGEFEEIEDEEEEFDEALIETDEGVEEPAAVSDFQFEDQEDDDVVVTEDVDDVDVTEDTEDVDEIFVPESAEDDEEPTKEAREAASEDAEAPVEVDQPEAEEEEEQEEEEQEEEAAWLPDDAEFEEPADEAATSSGKIDLGIDGDAGPSKVESDDDDLTNFLAGLN
jgi:predicted component of type VI protein secretion system